MFEAIIVGGFANITIFGEDLILIWRYYWKKVRSD